MSASSLVRRLPLALFGLLVCGPGQAQGLRIQDPVRDLGQLRPGVQRTEVFEVINDGPGPLTILDLKPECGCLTAQINRRRLAPGDSAKLALTITPPTQEGPITRTLEVLTEGASAPTPLVLMGDVRPWIHLSANDLTFEDLPRRGGGMAEVRLENEGGIPVQMTELRTSARYLAVEPQAQGGDMLLRIRMDGSRLPVDRTQGTDWIRIQAANPQVMEFQIQVHWTAKPLATRRISLVTK
jgi:hypothetical protein